MTELAIDPARLDAIHEALAQWRMFARSANRTAQAEQRRLSLDLLHAARHLAAGLDALAQLERQHGHHRTILRNLHGAAGNAADRIEQRLAMVRQLEAASARRVTGDDDSSAASRTEAARVHARATEEGARLADARQRTRRAQRDVARLLDRHADTDRELAALRYEFTELRAQAERGLALMTSAARLLTESGDLYEAAQLSASDLRRELLPGPVGPRYESPVVAAPERVEPTVADTLAAASA